MSCQDGSNEGSQHMFLLRIRKIISELSSLPPLTWNSELSLMDTLSLEASLLFTELQIRGGFEDNSKIIFHIFQ